MKRTIGFCLVSALWLSGCMSPIAPNEDKDALYERFHGKYEVVSSRSDIPVDVNFDGKASADLVQEIRGLKQPRDHYLQIGIYGKEKRVSSSGLTFTQWWPEQYIFLRESKRDWQWEPIAYDPSLLVNYAMQGATRLFSFSPDLTAITVHDSDSADKSVRWKKPLLVRIIGEHTIEIVNKKVLYTREGTKEVIITTVYERYTMVT